MSVCSAPILTIKPKRIRKQQLSLNPNYEKLLTLGSFLFVTIKGKLTLLWIKITKGANSVRSFLCFLILSSLFEALHESRIFADTAF